MFKKGEGALCCYSFVSAYYGGQVRLISNIFNPMHRIEDPIQILDRPSNPRRSTIKIVGRLQFG
jgi:hypothetical protein